MSKRTRNKSLFASFSSEKEDSSFFEKTEKAPSGRRSWRHIHHSLFFWVGIALCLVAMLLYVMSDDLSWR